MSYPYRATEQFRATAKQEARIVVHPMADGDGPPDSYRRVQLCIPAGADVHTAVDHFPQEEFDQEHGFGRDRLYRIGRVPSDTVLSFYMLNSQSLVIASEVGVSECSIFIEYLRRTED